MRLPRAGIVAAVLIAGLAIRVGYIDSTPFRAINDAALYNRLASGIARTGDYDTGSKPGSGAGGSRGPTAYFPPAYPYFLAAVDILDGHRGGTKAVGPERIAQAIAGTVAVGLLGLVALEVFGSTVALVSMVLAAVYPVLIALSGTLVAENLLVVFELAAVWTALRARRSQHPHAWIAATGVLTGLATLTHENAILLVIPLAFAAVSATRPRPNRTGPRARAASAQPRPNRTGPRALAAPTILIVMTLATIAPWTIRNALELHHFIPVSDENGITLVGTYNPTSAAFKPVPYKWRYPRKIPQEANLVRTAGRYTEVELGDKFQSQAFHYIAAHPLSPLEVAYHNTLRMFELEGSYAWHASALAIGMRVTDARTGVAAFWVVCLLALAGIFTAAARGAPRWIWALPLLYALSIVFVNAETPRFREPVDPFLILLAACAMATGLKRLGLRGAPVRSGRRSPGLAGDAKLVKMGERLP